MPWILLIVAGLFEVVWAYSMKLSNGFTKLTASIVFVVGNVFLGEQLSLMRVCASLLIVSGLVLMKLASH